uniref:Uncharacterized protein n=1 Tax=Bionectria ochroleuca TaxID=29856 RepID=A0A8H7N422_BIOOC
MTPKTAIICVPTVNDGYFGYGVGFQTCIRRCRPDQVIPQIGHSIICEYLEYLEVLSLMWAKNKPVEYFLDLIIKTQKYIRLRTRQGNERKLVDIALIRTGRGVSHRIDKYYE